MSSEISNEMSVENDNLQAESDDFLEKLNEYYKLKNEYETKKQVVKNNILKDDTLTMKQKQEKFATKARRLQEKRGENPFYSFFVSLCLCGYCLFSLYRL